MKKIIIGTLVATVIFFVYQSATWMTGFHSGFSSYTPNQDTILSALERNLSDDGLYFMPWANPDSPNHDKEQEELWTKNAGKPWATVIFHKSMSMGSSYMILGVLYTLLGCLIASLLLFHGNFLTFGSRFLASMALSLFTLCQGVLDNMNWWDYPWSFVKPEVIDLTLGWALVSLWLAKYVKK